MRFTPRPDGTGIPIYEQLTFKGMPVYSLEPTNTATDSSSRDTPCRPVKSTPTFHFGGHNAKIL